MHDYKINLDFDKLRKIYLLNEIENGKIYGVYDEEYECSILNLINNEIKFGEVHIDHKKCVFCSDEYENAKKIILENILNQSYLRKIQFNDFEKLLNECNDYISDRHNMLNKLVKNNHITVSRNIYKFDCNCIKCKDNPDCKSSADYKRLQILCKILNTDSIYDIEQMRLNYLFCDTFGGTIFDDLCLFYSIIHKINPYQYILENDLHYKLYKGLEDILNEHEHEKI
jgi:hypothetical protein